MTSLIIRYKYINVPCSDITTQWNLYINQVLNFLTGEHHCTRLRGHLAAIILSASSAT